MLVLGFKNVLTFKNGNSNTLRSRPAPDITNQPLNSKTQKELLLLNREGGKTIVSRDVNIFLVMLKQSFIPKISKGN